MDNIDYSVTDVFKGDGIIFEPQDILGLGNDLIFKKEEQKYMEFLCCTAKDANDIRPRHVKLCVSYSGDKDNNRDLNFRFFILDGFTFDYKLENNKKKFEKIKRNGTSATEIADGSNVYNICKALFK